MDGGPDRAPPAAFADVISSRRMCRDFLADPVEEAALARVVGAALSAPSAGNTAALDLVVLEGADTARYWDTTLPEPRRSRFRWPGLLTAPVLVLPWVEPDAYVRRYAEADKAHTGLGASAQDWPVPYWFVDGGAAVMAMLLAAEAEALGALLFGQFGHEAAVAEAFGVPAGRRALGTVALGHRRPGGASRSASAHRGRPRVHDVVHRGGW
jgi:nitroreductase